MVTMAVAVRDLAGHVSPEFPALLSRYGAELGLRNLARELRRAKPRMPKDEARRLRHLTDFRILAETLDGDSEAVRAILETEYADLEHELSRRQVPFGGRMAMSPAQAKRMEKRGFTKGFRNQYPGTDTPELVAKREAITEFLGGLS